LIFDPFADIGYDVKRTDADVVLCSHEHFDHHATHKIDCNTVIDYLASVTLDDVCITSLTTFHDDAKGAKRGINRVYKISAQNTSIVHLGDLGEITDELIDFIKNVDVLLVPVGGTYTIDHIQAKEVIDKTSPKFVIPMHYKSGKSQINIAPLSFFTSQFDKIYYHPSTVCVSNLKEGINVMEIDN
jgi:L-ascorbate metabolism protein UlaG (beta-lactamase superfamily)